MEEPPADTSDPFTNHHQHTIDLNSDPQAEGSMTVFVDMETAQLIHVDNIDTQADEVYNIADSVTKDDLLEIVQTSQKQLEILTNEIRAKEQQMLLISQQLAQTQKQLQTTALERDSLKDKNMTFNYAIKQSVEKLKDISYIDNVDQLHVPDSQVLAQQIVSDAFSQNNVIADTSDVNNFNICIQPKKRGRRKITRSKTKSRPISTSENTGLRLLMPRSTEMIGSSPISLFDPGVPITNLGFYDETAEQLQSSIYEVTAQASIEKRSVTVYNVVEGLKEHEFVLENPYPNCHIEGCCTEFNTTKDIEDHYKHVHQFGTIVSLKGKKKKPCDECEKGFLNVADLKLHKKWHHPVVIDQEARKAVIQSVAVLDDYGQPLLPIGGPVPKSSALKIDVITRPVLPPEDNVVASNDPPVAVHRKFECYYCKNKFSVKDFCDAHIRQKHFRIVRPYYCKTCGRNLRSRKTYQTHMDVHKMGERALFPCDSCSRMFVSQVNLRRHKLMHTNERPHLCSVCGLSFLQKGSLDNHMRTHGYRDALICEYCCRGYRCQSKLQEHIYAKHTDSPFYQCCACNLELPDHQSLVQHFKIHKTVNREKPFGCHLCPFSTYILRDLSSHLYAHERGVARREKKQRSYTSRQTIGPFICRFCLKRCIGKDYLELHEVRHTGIKKYKCSECSKAFAMEPLLKRHIESKHHGIRYPCKICGKEFTEAGNIKRHIEDIHNKSKPFACGVCDRVFSQKASLRVHLNTTAHKDRLYRLAQSMDIKSEELTVNEAVMDQIVFSDDCQITIYTTQDDQLAADPLSVSI